MVEKRVTTETRSYTEGLGIKTFSGVVSETLTTATTTRQTPPARVSLRRVSRRQCPAAVSVSLTAWGGLLRKSCGEVLY